jgi:hypothetical protein
VFLPSNAFKDSTLLSSTSTDTAKDQCYNTSQVFARPFQLARHPRPSARPEHMWEATPIRCSWTSIVTAEGSYNGRPSGEKNGCGPLKFPIGTK